MTTKIETGPPRYYSVVVPTENNIISFRCIWTVAKRRETYTIWRPSIDTDGIDTTPLANSLLDALEFLPPEFCRNVVDGSGHFLIKTPQHVRNLLLSVHRDFSNEGDVIVKMAPNGATLFNYAPVAQYRRRWNPFERMSRGLIINRYTGEIMARPFDKFFNYGEEPVEITSEIDYVMEKMDGSLGILYLDETGVRVATRGSLTSIQAAVAEEILHTDIKHEILDRDWTYMFEIIYPENRIVVDYGEERALYLLAARHKESGLYMKMHDLHKIATATGFKTPRIYPVTKIEDIVALKDKYPDREGVVAVFKDGMRVKFKADRYVELHRIVFGLTFQRVVEAVQAGTSSQEILAPIPDELYDKVNGWIEEIEFTVHQITLDVELVFEQAPKADRKEFALWVQKYHKHLAPYLFARMDNRPIRSLILKKYDWKEPAE